MQQVVPLGQATPLFDFDELAVPPEPAGLTSEPEASLRAAAAALAAAPIRVDFTYTPPVEAQRPRTLQRLALGADRGGRLLAIQHDPMIPAHARAAEPGGSFALESALDELADRLRLDPLALRRLNQPAATDRAPSSRSLLACYDAGAERFGWARRSPVRAARDGTYFLGTGMATARRGSHACGAIFAAVRVDPSIGDLRIERIVGAFAYPITSARAAHAHLLDGVVRGLGLVLESAARDLPRIDLLLVNDDRPVSPTDELDPTAVAAAVTNAVHHATGTRLRNLPIRTEHLLG